MNSSRPKLAEIPHLFAQITQEKIRTLFLYAIHQKVDYVPIGFFNSSNVAHDSCLIISGAQLHLFSVLTSRIHMSWLKTIGGKLKMIIDIQKYCLQYISLPKHFRTKKTRISSVPI